MSWIKSIEYHEAEGKLKRIYDRIKGPDGYIDNILKAHGLRPHSLEGHMVLYKNVLHHKDNSFPTQFLEVIGVYVSMLNKCNYCVDHHYQGMKRLIGDEAKSEKLKEALLKDQPEEAFEGKELAALKYAKKLTLNPSGIANDSYEALKSEGFDDGEILEINQVTAYFSYANRTVLGLGISTKGDILGLSPNDKDETKNWSHS